MLKTRKFLLFFVLALSLITLSACAGETGATGPAGPAGPAGADGVDGADGADGVDGMDGVDGTDGADGADGVDGVDGVDGATGPAGIDGIDGLDGANGLSAYEIYMAAYPGYAGTEDEWIAALAADELVLTVSVLYTNGLGAEVEVIAGDVLGASPYAVNWFLDAGFANVADDTVVNADLMVYVNMASEDLPTNLASVYPITSMEVVWDDVAIAAAVAAGADMADIYDATFEGMMDTYVLAYVFNSGQMEFTVASNAALYFSDGDLDAIGDSQVWYELEDECDLEEDGLCDYEDAILADIVVLDGEVIELRWASDETEFDTSDDDLIEVNYHTTDGYITGIEMLYGLTVLDVMNTLESVDGLPQTYVIYDDEGDVVTSATAVVDYGYTLMVIAENEYDYNIWDLMYENWDIDFFGNPDNLDVDQTDDTVIEEEDEFVVVLPGTTGADLFASWEATDADYPVAWTIYNSEMVAKTEDELFDGDKVYFMSYDGYETELVVVMVEEANDTEIEFDGEETDATIDVAWNFLADDVLALVTSANGYVQTYELLVEDTDEDSDTFGDMIAYVNDEVMLSEGNFELLVTAEDGETEATYTFNELTSDSTVVQVVEGMDYVVTELDAMVSVAFDTEDDAFATALEGADGSVPTYAVETPGGATRSGRLYTGDVLVVTSEDGEETAELTIMVNAALDDADLYDELDDMTFEILLDISGGELEIAASLYEDTDEEPTDVDVSDVMDALDNDLAQLIGFKYQADPEFLMENPDYQPDEEEDDFDDEEFIDWDEEDLSDLIVRITAQDGEETEDYEVEFASKSDETDIDLVEEYDETIIEDFSGTTISVFAEANASVAEVMEQFDLEANFQWYEVDGDEVTVYAQDVEEFEVYTIVEFEYDETDLGDALVEAPVVIDDISGDEIEVLPESELGEATDLDDILADLDADVYFMDIDDTFYVWDDVNDEWDADGADDVLDFDYEEEDAYFIQVTSEDGEEVEYYEIIVLDKSDDVDVYGVEDQEDFTVDGDTITVNHDTTVAELEAAMDLAANFQEADFEENDGTAKGSGDLFFAYDTVTITAQDGTEEVYFIEVLAAPVTLSDSTALDSVDNELVLGTDPGVVFVEASFTYEDATEAHATTEADLLAELAENYEDMTFEITTSEMLAKAEDALFDYDVLKVTAEDGEEVAYYTIMVEVD